MAQFAPPPNTIRFRLLLTHGAGPLVDVPAVVGNVGLQPDVEGVAGGLDSVLLQHELHHAVKLLPKIYELDKKNFIFL